jgi:hypothetical protein
LTESAGWRGNQYLAIQLCHGVEHRLAATTSLSQSTWNGTTRQTPNI